MNDRWLKAVDGIRKSQEYSAKYFKKHSRPPKIYSVGDYVVIRQKHNPIGKGKLSENYRGPYVITKVLDKDRYVVEDIENCQLTQIPYKGIIEANNLKSWISENH